MREGGGGGVKREKEGERDGGREGRETRRELYSGQPFQTRHSGTLHWSDIDIARVNSLNKTAVIKIVEICSLALEREKRLGWGRTKQKKKRALCPLSLSLSLSRSSVLALSLGCESLTEHRDQAVKTPQREGRREGAREREKEGGRRRGGVGGGAG